MTTIHTSDPDAERTAEPFTDPPAEPGLRERKKARTREALSWAALRLAVERGGLDNVLVEDIAAAANVSPRTFNNYFSSKAEAIGSRHLDRFMNIVAALRAEPPGEPLWDALTRAVTAQALMRDRHPDPQWLAGLRLVTGDPTLVGEFLKANAIAERELAQVIAERIGADAETDLYPRLVAAAVGAALRVSTHHWLTADPPVPMAPLLRDALTQLAAGLPDPSAKGER